ncbi:LPXTG cell wall anchor domain-containing protein [Limosilactobacillus reuteri]|uniref:LPXTG cell wall anchor domain-containing protein n=1 Tax=Limosilactobacillus reuteri TaxID=1598 RepID=UPI001E2F49F4|nr:LPXTG cell wall anchor domain-containing protein [Limosilactobacillus reuteri]MCC4390202.1 LPXTG cell wall anchor domain-containing protein [Limosilactobacillus reuteri]MCC4427554.1 LPXTG cell wall anchor domain-containing protein [Limosilactobacillus reuteri]MCC4432258.1 LPXTG cell wall anchor domain-containing protein [Limosilactobacillus reuteri]MCC4433562.1 LPXTG cell wall anchor domain-containing protein [Limosilactobacillus reuteri]
MKKRKLKKSLATTATVMAVTTGVTAISNSAKADTVQNSKNTIQQTLPDVNQQAQRNVSTAQDAVNRANADVATANNDLNIANQNLADADQNVDLNKNQVKQTKEQLSSLEQTKENAQQVLANAHDEYYELLKQPVDVSYMATSGGGLSVYEGSMLDCIAYDNQGNLISENQAYKNFLANDYQGNIDLLKKIIAKNEKTINYLKMGRPFEDNIKNLEQAKVTIKEELEELYKLAAAQREGKYYKPKDDIGWISTDSYGLSYSYSSSSYNEWDDVDKIDHTKKLIENHEEALNKVQQRLVELHNKMQSAVEKAEKTSIAAQELLQKLEQISQPLITATQQIKDAESAMSQAQQNLALQEELLTETKDKRNIMQSQAINAQTKLLQALLNKTNSQEKLASAKEKLPMQTDALKYSSLINLEPLTIEPGETPLPKVTTAIAVENDHQNKAVITLPGDEQENKLPQGTKVVWKDDAKVATDLQRPGKHTEDVLIVFPDGSVILTSEQVTVSATEKQADANKETSPAQKTIDSTQENNMRANDLSAQVVEVNDDNQTSAPEILVTSQTKQHTVRPNGVIKGPAALNNIVQPSLAKSFEDKTRNNVLPRTGDESSLSIIALGAVIGLAGIGAILKRYE